MTGPTMRQLACLLYEMLGPDGPSERDGPPLNDEERRAALRGRVIDAGEPTMRELTKLIDGRRPFVFVPCPSCAEGFFMTFELFGANGQLWFLPSLISEALAQHHTEEHPAT